MTLSTDIYVLDPVDARELFTECQRILGTFDEDGRGPERQEWTGRSGSLSNKLGQGLPAILTVHHGADGPYRADEQAHHEWCDDDCDGKYHDPACWSRVNLDTTYGYNSTYGGCGDLHARIIFELSKWLGQRDVRFSWENEFTGDVYEGIAGLDTLCSGGREASAWFYTSVLPAITSASLVTVPADAEAVR